MSEVTAQGFLDRLQQSQLIPADQLKDAIEQIKSGNSGTPRSGTELAQLLIQQDRLTNWQADKILAGRFRGFFLGKYKLLGHLGTGGMSSVYLAEHSLIKRRVAIKVLPATRIGDSSFLERFLREAKAAAALDHPNIIRAYDIDQHEKSHYLVMEYIDGLDLNQLVKQKGPLRPATAADYIAQTADGLQHAHQSGLVHRDIKPANLLVDEHRVVKILDLGLALFVDDKLASVTLKHSENVMGTADYLAPEQARDSHGVDHRVDIYSLGCTFFFLLTGRPPFTGGTLAQRVLKHQVEAPPNLADECPDCPPGYVEVCQKMMAKKPEDRFASASEVATVLRQYAPTSNSETDVEFPVGVTPESAIVRPTIADVRVPESESVLGRRGRGRRRVKTPIGLWIGLALLMVVCLGLMIYAAFFAAP